MVFYLCFVFRLQNLKVPRVKPILCDVSAPHKRVQITQETEREQILIEKLMHTTFGLRRRHIVQGSPGVREFLENWPASQVFAEFHRITNVNPRNQFYCELERYTPKLVALYRQKSSRTGKGAEALQEMLRIDDLDASSSSWCPRRDLKPGETGPSLWSALSSGTLCPSMFELLPQWSVLSLVLRPTFILWLLALRELCGPLLSSVFLKFCFCFLFTVLIGFTL
nr:uncharacterized protein LOC133623392 [Nerophis lumbriciformis]